MCPRPMFYTRPSRDGLVLAIPPRLASWNSADHPDQTRLTAALQHAEDVLRPLLAASTATYRTPS